MRFLNISMGFIVKIKESTIEIYGRSKVYRQIGKSQSEVE